MECSSKLYHGTLGIPPFLAFSGITREEGHKGCLKDVDITITDILNANGRQS